MSAILAKILNSTVGTSSLKALDTILKADNTTIANNAADRLFNNLKSNSKLVGSDDVMYKYTGGWGISETSKYGLGSSVYVDTATSFIQFDKAGTVYIKAECTNSSSSDTPSYYIGVINEAGTVVDKVNYYVEGDATVEISLSLNVTSGVKYKIFIGRKDRNPTVGDVTVCGKTILFGATVTATT